MNLLVKRLDVIFSWITYPGLLFFAVVLFGDWDFFSSLLGGKPILTALVAITVQVIILIIS